MISRSDYAFYIPSRERGKWLLYQRHHTLRYLKDLKPILYVRSDDSQLKWYEQYAAKYNTPMKVYDPEGIDYCSQTYDSLINRSIYDGYKYLIVLDDDLTSRYLIPSWMQDHSSSTQSLKILECSLITYSLYSVHRYLS